ncbi:hypothetical protein Gpo141_00013146 [Globisporangium polare]
MSLVEGAALPHKWLDIATYDGHTIKSRVSTSGAMRDLAAWAELHDVLLTRFRDAVAVLETLQERVPHAPELYEPLQDLAFAAWFQCEFVKRFREELFLCQLIRSHTLAKCVQHTHDGMDEFLRKVRRSSLSDDFHQCAADLGIEISTLDHSNAYWRDQFDAASQEQRGDIEERVLHLFEDTADPDVRRKVVWTLVFEIERSDRRGVSDSFIEIVRNVMVPALTAEAPVTPYWFIPADSIHLGQHIAKGGCGVVCRGKLEWATPIAVKRLLVTERETEELARIKKLAHEREIQVWQDLNHPHILQFYGATSFGADCSVVSELASKGKLYDYWLNPVDPLLKAQMWRLLFEASLGVQYMHSKGFVHGDLKCDNIFVGDDWKAKVADFGLSFQIGQHKNVPCTEAANWLAPECLDKERARTFATDVFMFGMCIVEALCGGPPWGSSPEASVRRFLKLGKLSYIINQCAPEVQELVRAMCAFEPADRISMDEVVRRLKALDVANDPQLLEVSEEEQPI